MANLTLRMLQTAPKSFLTQPSPPLLTEVSVIFEWVRREGIVPDFIYTYTERYPAKLAAWNMLLL